MAARSGNPTRLAELPEEERPRERLMRLGPGALSERELLAILLRTGRRGSNALDLARQVLQRAETPARLSRLSVSQLVKGCGLGRVQAVTIAAALELARRAAAAPARRERFGDPETVMRYLLVHRAHLSQEQTGALLLDAKNRLLKDVICYQGTLDRAMVEPRAALKAALLEDAAGVILYHNHPSGDPSPSAEDIEFTRRLDAAARVLGIRLIDHMIVGHEGCVSLRERGAFPD
jgi:DNA repair protein RadC